MARASARRVLRHRVPPRAAGVAQRYALPDERSSWACGAMASTACRTTTSCTRWGTDTLGRAVIAHLGNGASMVAIRDGQPIDTTMGIEPRRRARHGRRAAAISIPASPVPARARLRCAGAGAARPPRQRLARAQRRILRHARSARASRRRIRVQRARSPRSARARASGSARSPRRSTASTRSCSPAASARTRRSSARRSPRASRTSASASTTRATGATTRASRTMSATARCGSSSPTRKPRSRGSLRPRGESTDGYPAQRSARRLAGTVTRSGPGNAPSGKLRTRARNPDVTS